MYKSRITSAERRHILSFLMQKRPDEILGLTDSQLPGDIRRAVFDAAKRREAGEPLQYILGEWEFYGLRFKTDKRALIPRPETELMVEMILAKWGSGVLPRPSGTTPLRIADICTGSGCIAVTLAKLLQSSGCSVEITAVDICPDALALAKENAALHGVGESIRFVCADLRGEGFVEKVGALENSPRGNFGTFDVIVSNPPYIATGELDSLQREVRDHEPRLALDGGVCGMDLYEQLLPKAKLLLRPGGMIYLEIGSEKVVDLAREVGFGDVQLHFDYAGLPRVVVGVG